MKKVISLVLVALLLVPFMGYSRLVKADSVRAARMTEGENDTSSLDQFSFVEVESLNKPKTMDIGHGWSYACVDMWGDYILTTILKNGHKFYLLGEWYFDFYSELFIPFGTDDKALRLRPTENNLVVFGNVVDESDGEVHVEVQSPIAEGNSIAYLRNYKKPFVGGGDYYEFWVIVPDMYANVPVDVDDLYTIYLQRQGYIPGQNGEIFILSDTCCQVRYCRYDGQKKTKSNDSIYTFVSLDNGMAVFLKGEFLYNPGYDVFYLYNEKTGLMEKTIKFKYIDETFKVSCGGINYIDENYIRDEEGNFILEESVIGITGIPSSVRIELKRMEEGIPFITY